jgi:hypothetical protein
MRLPNILGFLDTVRLAMGYPGVPLPLIRSVPQGVAGWKISLWLFST